jgi:hypothetical protein
VVSQAFSGSNTVRKPVGTGSSRGGVLLPLNPGCRPTPTRILNESLKEAFVSALLKRVSSEVEASLVLRRRHTIAAVMGIELQGEEV